MGSAGAVWSGLVALVREEFREESRALGGENPVERGRVVVQAGIGDHAVQAGSGTSLEVRRAVHEGADAGVQKCTRTHQAGFEGHDQRAVIEAPAAGDGGGVAQGEHLRMGRGVDQVLALVVTGRDHLPVAHHHRAHRHVAVRERGTGLLQGRLHRLHMFHGGVGGI